MILCEGYDDQSVSGVETTVRRKTSSLLPAVTDEESNSRRSSDASTTSTSSDIAHAKAGGVTPDTSHKRKATSQNANERSNSRQASTTSTSIAIADDINVRDDSAVAEAECPNFISVAALRKLCAVNEGLWRGQLASGEMQVIRNCPESVFKDIIMCLEKHLRGFKHVILGGTLILTELPSEVHEVTSRHFDQIATLSYTRTILGTGSLNLHFLDSHLEPDASFRSRDRQSYDHLLQLPGERRWPSVVVEIGVSETFSSLHKCAAYYLSPQTPIAGVVTVKVYPKRLDGTAAMVFSFYRRPLLTAAAATAMGIQAGRPPPIDPTHCISFGTVALHPNALSAIERELQGVNVVSGEGAGGWNGIVHCTQLDPFIFLIPVAVVFDGAQVIPPNDWAINLYDLREDILMVL
jgi:hypothetical protein